MEIENELLKLNKKLLHYIETLESSLQNMKINEDFFLIDLKEFDDDVIKILTLNPKGEYLRETVAYLKISPFIGKIKKSIKSFIKNYNFNDQKIDALYQNAILSLSTLKDTVEKNSIEFSYSSIISYEKIADEIYKELIIEIKEKNLEEVLKIINVAKKLERISDNVKTIARYLLFVKE
ncbi:MAG: PhoU family transcriptional regulator [Epsilonproteobacteria bacterium]|nr:PhoU family transcriptional regulator [Campylobacterota bacterium]